MKKCNLLAASLILAFASINHERSPVLLVTDAQRDTWIVESTARQRPWRLCAPPMASCCALCRQGASEKEDLLGAGASRANVNRPRHHLALQSEKHQRKGLPPVTAIVAPET